MTGRVTLGNGEVRTLASPGARAGARVIDWVIIFIVSSIVSVVGLGGGLAMGSTGSDAGIAAMFGALFMTFITVGIIAIGYEVTLVALKGQTVGKMVVGIRVARADNGDLPGWGPAAIRWALPGLVAFIIPVFGMLAALVVYLSFLWDDRRQGWHDKAAATVVVS
jgi:uncharacterized RDD family membrane protein YckC